MVELEKRFHHFIILDYDDKLTASAGGLYNTRVMVAHSSHSSTGFGDA
jgi:hypothetical protein